MKDKWGLLREKMKAMREASKMLADDSDKKVYKFVLSWMDALEEVEGNVPLNPIHNVRYNDLLQRDNTSPQDIERQSLFYILSGNQDLYSHIDSLYDFKEHSIKTEESQQADFSSGCRAMIELAYNLYNGFGDRTIKDTFINLDNYNAILAINVIQLRFNIQESTYSDEYDETEEEKEIFREWTERRKIKGIEIWDE